MKIKESIEGTVTMIDRAADVLEYLFSLEGTAGVSEIARNLELPKANAFRILQTLVQRGIVDRDDKTDGYTLGRHLVKYGEKVKRSFTLNSLAEPILLKLSSETGETANLGVLYEEEVLTILSEAGESSVLVSILAPVAPLYCSSMGKLFLAERDAESIQAYFHTARLVSRTIHTIMDADTFIQKEKVRIQKDGVSYDNEEYEYGLSCMASPVRRSDGSIIAAVGISGPTGRIQYKGIAMIEDKVREAAFELSRQMEYLLDR